jgi:signal transduction histidine kinase
MSLRARILAYVVLVMAIVSIMVVATITPDTLHDSSSALAAGREAADTLQEFFQKLTAAQRKDLFNARVKLFAEQHVLGGWVLVGKDNTVHYWGMPGEAPEKVDTAFLVSQHFDRMHLVFTPDGERLLLYWRTSLKLTNHGLDLWGIILVMLLGTLFLSLVIYGLMLRLVIKPVERLAAANRSAAVARGLLQPVPHTDRPDEIGELVRAYNKMVGEVNDLRINLEKRVSEATRSLEAAQNQIVLSERLSVAGRMAAGVAHEINNPLGGMLNAARTLKSKAPPSTRESEYMDLILEGLTRIQGIMASMLQFSRPVQQASKIDLPDVIEGALMFCRHRIEKMDLKLEKDIPAEGMYVTGHRAELGQVFLNLLVNAIDAMETKGAGPHKLVLRVYREGGSVVASVADSGAGMTAEVKERAGQFFFSTKGEGKGTGLGLAVVQHIVLQHKGSMKIESSEGSGTTISVLLPAEETAAQRVA